MTNTKLRIEDLTKTFGNEVAVDGLTMSVNERELKSLLGPSGCGKTTTLRCVAGLEKPDSGRIYIGGELVSDPEENIHHPPEDRGIGMVFQSYAIWPHMTVKENVMYPLNVQNIGTKEDRERRVEEALERVGLEPYSESLATQLSGGQQQRVAFSRAMVVEPEVMLFDEPLSNLDAKLRREMRGEIKELYKQHDMTVFYVTHSQDEAMFLSDEIAIMRDGRIVEESDPVTLHRNPQTYFGMNFMGQCNILRGTIEAGNSDASTLQTALGAIALSEVPGDVSTDKEIYVCFRPKEARILAPDEEVADHLVFRGTLDMIAATRDFVEYKLNSGDVAITVRHTDPVEVVEGDTVRVGVPATHLKVFSAETEQLMGIRPVGMTGDPTTA